MGGLRGWGADRCGPAVHGEYSPGPYEAAGRAGRLVLPQAVPVLGAELARADLRDRAQQCVHEPAQQRETPKGVERYLAQFWPV